MEGTPENGGLVDVLAGSAYLGTGFLQRCLQDHRRLISRSANDRFDAAFWRRRVEYALRYRRTVMPGPDFKVLPPDPWRGRPDARSDGGSV